MFGFFFLSAFQNSEQVSYIVLGLPVMNYPTSSVYLVSLEEPGNFVLLTTIAFFFGTYHEQPHMNHVLCLGIKTWFVDSGKHENFASVVCKTIFTWFVSSRRSLSHGNMLNTKFPNYQKKKMLNTPTQ